MANSETWGAAGYRVGRSKYWGIIPTGETLVVFNPSGGIDYYFPPTARLRLVVTPVAGNTPLIGPIAVRFFMGVYGENNYYIFPGSLRKSLDNPPPLYGWGKTIMRTTPAAIEVPEGPYDDLQIGLTFLPDPTWTNNAAFLALVAETPTKTQYPFAEGKAQ